MRRRDGKQPCFVGHLDAADRIIGHNRDHGVISTILRLPPLRQKILLYHAALADNAHAIKHPPRTHTVFLVWCCSKLDGARKLNTNAYAEVALLCPAGVKPVIR